MFDGKNVGAVWDFLWDQIEKDVDNFYKTLFIRKIWDKNDPDEKDNGELEYANPYLVVGLYGGNDCVHINIGDSIRYDPDSDSDFVVYKKEEAKK